MYLVVEAMIGRALSKVVFVLISRSNRGDLMGIV